MVIPAKLRPWAGPLLIALSLLLIGWYLRKELRHYSYHEIVLALRSLPTFSLIAAGFLTLGSYIILTGYDGLALNHLGEKLGAIRTGFASFIAFVVTNNVGLGALGSGAVRLRLYGAWGLTAVDILTMQAFIGATFWLGLATTAGAAWLITGGPMDSTWGRAAGGLLLLVGPAYLGSCAIWRRPIRLWRWAFTLPRVRIALLQIVLGSTDIVIAGSVLWVLLPAGVGSWDAFLALYAGALATAVISQVPGGLGVLEAIVLLGRPEQVSADATLAALVAFRVIYYLLPLSVAAVLLGAFEIGRHRRRMSDWAAKVGLLLPLVAPRVLAVATFMAGVVLLVSGATPSVQGRMAWLNDLLPLPIIETSHLVGSVAGVGLLLLARGLQRRLDAAYILTLALLVTGIVASLLKGIDWEEALVLLTMFGALVPCRSFFNRRSALRAERFTPGWIVAIALVVGGVTWLGFFAFRHVEYRDELWWQFAHNADAPRFLRAQLAGMVVLLVLSLHRLLQVSATELEEPAAIDPAVIARLAVASPATSAQLVFTGDKEVMLDASGKGFVMFGRTARSWVALGDPVSNDEIVRRELIWRLRERADRVGARAVFYQVKHENLAGYLDAGFGLTKIGEEARVPLPSFSMAGSARRSLRNAVSKLEREGTTFEWVEATGVAGIMAELRRVSDTWLKEKSVREKGFSLGFFNEAYLARNPVVVVRRAGRMVAFANVWIGADREELSIDLMRYDTDAPSGVMDYLFVKLILRGAAEGYRWFNLGMAPLSGMETRAMAPISHRLGGFIYRHADHFYGFQGLRAYKAKFDPVWEPRYLAVAGVWHLPVALADITILVSGGMRGVFMK